VHTSARPVCPRMSPAADEGDQHQACPNFSCGQSLEDVEEVNGSLVCGYCGFILDQVVLLESNWESITFVRDDAGRNQVASVNVGADDEGGKAGGCTPGVLHCQLALKRSEPIES